MFAMLIRIVTYLTGLKRIRKVHALMAIMSVVCVLMSVTGCSDNGRQSEIEYMSEKYAVPDEKQLVIWTSHKEEVYMPIIREFETRTGIWVDLRTGGTAELMGMIENSDMNSTCDIMFGGGAESYEAQKHLFIPYKSQEIESVKGEYISKEDLWTPFTELPIVFVYNPKLISIMDAPKSWKELMDDTWKGNIAFADMDVSGTSYTIVSIMSQIFNEDLDTFVPEFYEHIGGTVLQSSGDIIPSVAEGEYLIGITLEETAKKFIDKGYDIKMIYPSDGTAAVPDACAIVRNAPHSYNAGKFIDFILERDTQMYVMEQLSRRPVRTDIELSEAYSDIKLINFDIQRSAADEDEAIEVWHKISEKKI
jgi:iron(III) transport system substrate-binding protein